MRREMEWRFKSVRGQSDEERSQEVKYGRSIIKYQLSGEKIMLVIFNFYSRSIFGIVNIRIWGSLFLSKVYIFEFSSQCTLNHLNRRLGEKVMTKILKSVRRKNFITMRPHGYNSLRPHRVLQGSKWAEK